MDVLRARQLVSATLEPSEASSLESIVDALFSEEEAVKQQVLQGLVSGEGDFNGVSCQYTLVSSANLCS